MSAVLILCYKRLGNLKEVIRSLKQLNIDRYYFHLHIADTPEGQILVDEVYDYIKTLDVHKDVLYVNKPLGCRKAFFSALKYISKKEDKFYFIEDDIVVNEGSSTVLSKEFNDFKGVLKFGPSSEKQGIFWGWALDKESADCILETELHTLKYDDCKEVFENELHYRGFIELHRRGKVQPWDDEVGQIIKLKNINVTEIDCVATNIGRLSSRVGGIPDGEIKGNNYVTFVNNKLIN